MAKYRVLTKSFIGNALVEEGAVVEYDGDVSDNLEPLDDEAVKVAGKSKTANVKSVARQKAAAIGGDPDSAHASAAVTAAAAAAEKTLAQQVASDGLV